MGRAEALLKVVGSRPENLADNFFTLLPAATPADFQRIVDLKVPPARSSAPAGMHADGTLCCIELSMPELLMLHCLAAPLR